MADRKGPTMVVGNNKLAMSRALGAAFLSHQVEQLERSVGTPAARNGGQNAWRGGRPAPGAPRGAGGNPITAVPKVQRREEGKPVVREKAGLGEARPRRSNERKREKDADVVVVDASVLVHGLGQVKVWCREGREEVLIVPLEALNTLDLLKKGTSILAQRARAASRILESQVGTNPRIRVQSDDAFVAWDDIPFTADATTGPPGSSPEWVRRTVCCARWEATHAPEADADPKAPPKVVFAVLAPDVPAQSGKADAANASPVPLPAPMAMNKHEPRAAGTLVTAWARRAGVPLFPVKALPDEPHAEGGNFRPPGRSIRAHPEARRGGGGGGGGSHATPLVERPPAVAAMMERVAQPKTVVRLLARGEKLDP